jgi:hypothetical protein
LGDGVLDNITIGLLCVSRAARSVKNFKKTFSSTSVGHLSISATNGGKIHRLLEPRKRTSSRTMDWNQISEKAFHLWDRVTVLGIVGGYFNPFIRTTKMDRGLGIPRHLQDATGKPYLSRTIFRLLIPGRIMISH